MTREENDEESNQGTKKVGGEGGLRLERETGKIVASRRRRTACALVGWQRVEVALFCSRAPPSALSQSTNKLKGENPRV